MQPPNGTLSYVAKYAYNGNLSASQLSFAVGDTIIAKGGQDSNQWWWGRCNGRDGWFPPAYVALKRQQQPTMRQSTFQNQIAMTSANSMQSGSMLTQSSVSTANSGGSSMSMMGNGKSSGFGSGGMDDDPFAGLDNSPVSMSLPSGKSSSAGNIGVKSSGSAFTGNNNAYSSSGATSPIRQSSAPSYVHTTTGNNNLNVSSNASVVSTSGNRSVTSMSSQGTNRSTSMTNKASDSNGINKDVDLKSNVKVQSSFHGGTSGHGSVNSVRSPSSNVSRSSSLKSVQSATSSSSNLQTTKSKIVTVGSEKDGAVEIVALTESSNSRNNGMSRKEQELQRQLDEQKWKEEELKEELRKEKERNSGDAATVAANQTSAMISSASTSMSNAMNETYKSVIRGYNAFALLAGAGGGATPTQDIGPIYRSPGFWSLMKLDTYVRRLPIEHPNISAHFGALKKALGFYSYIAQQSQNSLDSLGGNQGTLEAGIRLIEMLPYESDPKETQGQFIDFINSLVNLIGHLPTREQIILPGGWKNPDGHHIMLYILRNVGNQKFTFSVCNAGLAGLEYHASRFDEASGKHLKNLAMTLWDIPAKCVLDSSFWTLLFYMVSKIFLVTLSFIKFLNAHYLLILLRSKFIHQRLTTLNFCIPAYCPHSIRSLFERIYFWVLLIFSSLPPRLFQLRILT